MLRSRTVILLFAGFGAGCAAKPEPVWIDLTAIPVGSPLVAGPVEILVPSSGRPQSAEIQGLPARTMLIGSGQGEAKAAIQAAKENQERAFRQALSELQETYRTEAKAQSELAASKLRLEYDGKFRALFVDLREVFDLHAAKVGPLWTRLATLNGFPDKGPPKREPPEADFLKRAEVNEAKEVRKRIKDLDAQYRFEVAGSLEQLRQQVRADRTTLEANRVEAMHSADVRAESEAKDMVTRILKDMEQSLIQDIENLATVPKATVRLQGLRGPTVSMPVDPGETWPARDRLEKRAGLFARIHGYRLAQRGAGARDVTKEFLDWDKQVAGR